MPDSFEKVNKASEQVLFTDRRYIYTTPKSFLELIKLFKNMLSKKEEELLNAQHTYEEGVQRLTETKSSAVVLAENLKSDNVIVEEKRKSADEKAVKVEAAKKIAEESSAKANEEAKKCAEKKVVVEEKKSKVQKDVDDAQPLVEKAKGDVANLDQKLFNTIKGWRSQPPKKAGMIGQCIMHLLADPPHSATDKPKVDWASFLAIMQNPTELKNTLLGMIEKINEGKVPAKNIKECKQVITDGGLDEAGVASTSQVLVPLFHWIQNMLIYYETISGIEPKRAALREANEQLRDATEKKEAIDAQVAELTEQLAQLQEEYDIVTPFISKKRRKIDKNVHWPTCAGRTVDHS